jgi:hypothetical protein
MEHSPARELRNRVKQSPSSSPTRTQVRCSPNSSPSQDNIYFNRFNKNVEIRCFDFFWGETGSQE